MMRNKMKTLLAGLLPALALLALAGVADAQGNRWAPYESASDYGYRFEELFWLITVLCSIAFGIVLLLILIPTVRDRARPGHKASFDHGSSLHDKRLTAFISVVTFIVLDAWVLVIAMRDLREAFWKIPEIDEPGVQQIEVLAQQWAWNFRHAGSDGEFGTPDDILEMNHLTVPKDHSVSFQLTSKDVIHSLFLPEMRMKKDANPGAINETWFKPITSGEFTILCAELCGYAHYQMHGKLTVLDIEDFNTWEETASQLAVAAHDPEDVEAQWAWDWQE
jgi:cytochrome c oxidase subunit 2